MSRLALVLAVGAMLASACKSEDKSKDHSGLPPATDWNAPAPGAVATGGTAAGAEDRVRAQGTNPHVGTDTDPSNPHAGLGLPPPSGDVDDTPPGASLPPPDPNRAIDPNKYLEGTLQVDDKVKSLVSPGAVVFLSVKSVDPKTGEPVGASLAVERLVVQTFPLPFRLTQRNAMTDGTGFAGDVVISAWTDNDLDASTKQPGDVLGSVKATIPAKGLSLVLNSVQQ